MRRTIAAPQGLKLRGGQAVVQAVGGQQVAVARAARALPDVQPGFGDVAILVAIVQFIIAVAQHQAVGQALVHGCAGAGIFGLHLSSVEHLLPEGVVTADLQPLHAAVRLRAQPPDARIAAVDGAHLALGTPQAGQGAGGTQGARAQGAALPLLPGAAHQARQLVGRARDSACVVQRIEKAAAGQVGTGARCHTIGHRHPGPSALGNTRKAPQGLLPQVAFGQRLDGQRVLLRLGAGAAQGRRVHGLLEGVDVHGGRHGNGFSRGDWRRSVAALERIQACKRALASGM